MRPRPTTVYLETVLPDVPHVPKRLRGATCRVRLNSTIKELEAGIHRAAHIRAFPEQDPVFEKLFGLREDTESHNAKVKGQLWGRRARTTDPERNMLNMAIWQIDEINRARMAHRARLARQATGPPTARAG